jgi:hypothetical protein
MKQIYVLTLLILCLLGSAEAAAWGQIGHRVTGEIAEGYLSEEARAAIEDLLPNETLAEASTYADEMRSNPDSFWQDVAGPYHYVTVPKGKVYADVGAPKQGDSVSALNAFRKTLLDPRASRAQKQLALRFTIHLVGDLHQPLHAGNGTDRGGNDLKVQFFYENSNLHRVWDSQMIDRRQLSYSEWSEWLGNKISAEQAKEWATPDPSVWIEESTQIRDTIYPDGTNLGWDYLYTHLPTATERLQQAGIRLAAYLNDLYKK